MMTWVDDDDDAERVERRAMEGGPEENSCKAPKNNIVQSIDDEFMHHYVLRANQRTNVTMKYRKKYLCLKNDKRKRKESGTYLMKYVEVSL